MNELQCLSECIECQGEGYVPQPFSGPALLTLWPSLQPSVEALEPNVS